MRGLTSMSWERVDVNFSRSIQGLLAHTTIQASVYRVLYCDRVEYIVKFSRNTDLINTLAVCVCRLKLTVLTLTEQM